MNDVRVCTWCLKEGVRVRKDGALWRHWDGLRNKTCEQRPVPEGWRVGRNNLPCFCGSPMEPGCLYYPVGDGESVYSQCTECYRGQVSEATPTVDSMETTTEQPAPVDEADAFLDGPAPTASTQSADDFLDEDDEVPPGLVHRGKYLITDPRTGEFRRFKTSGNIDGFTRATTFVKAATDSKALNDWGKRNVLLGAAARPDVAAKAYGLKNERENSSFLDDLVEELYVAANAHVPAEQGTLLHSYRERLDDGELTMEQIPPVWRRSMELYYEALQAYGLTPVKGLSERVTMTHNYGGVAGRFDQVYHHATSRTYIMGDLKTGKTMEYGKKEIPAQQVIYVEGFNEYGVYDQERRVWERPLDPDGNPVQLRTDIALILHMPVQGDLMGTFRFLPVDLEVGRGYARLCQENRAFKAPTLTEWDGKLPGAPEPPSWDERFASVTSSEQATAMWREARAAGISGVRLTELVSLAQMALRQGLTQAPERVELGS